MNFTTVPVGARPAGLMYQARMRWPPKPEKLTSNTSNSGKPRSTGVNTASSPWLRASPSVSAQKLSKSAGAAEEER